MVFDCGSVLGYYFDIKLNIGEIERESNRRGGGRGGFNKNCVVELTYVLSTNCVWIF